MRTKRYRKLLFLYGNSKDKDKRKTYAKQLNEMQKAYNITWEYCRTSNKKAARLISSCFSHN